MKIKFLSFLSVIVLLAAGCSKFEEGPGFSLRTKKARIQNTWIVEKAFINDSLIAGSPVDSFYIFFSKKGEVQITSVIDSLGAISYETTSGSWDFIDISDSPKLAMVLNDNNTPFGNEILIWEIIRLANDELWIRYENDLKDMVEIDFIPQ